MNSNALLERRIARWAKISAALILCGMTAVVAPAQTFKTLYSFCSQTNCVDGSNPTAALLQATNGYLYGTTDGGGPVGGGTIFRIAPTRALTTLYGFCLQSGCTDGEQPTAGLIQAVNGNLYGTTIGGGGGNNGGTVFKITPSGSLTTLYSFCSQNGCADGSEPLAALVQGSDGNFYGTTWYGGANGEGTVFKITPSGTLTTLYSFCAQANCADGAEPHAGLIEGTDGNFYGTTEGGTSSLGTVFRITRTGTLTTLHSFGLTDGANPFAGLVQAIDGNFYGTTSSDGANSAGTLFKITPTGALTTLYSFCAQSGCADGDGPLAGVVQDTNGNFYGTTYNGGTFAGGTVFALSVGLGPFVEAQPTSGKVGAAVKILGTNLTGATSVTFNGTAATFTVSSRSLITATVPTGATTGIVHVTTPSGTLSSNVKFRVLP